MALFKETSYPLTRLVEEIDAMVIGLPDIQRPFVWKDTQVRELFDSMYKGYPVGYLLFWENAYQEHTRTIGNAGTQRAPSLLIVDGQQRLTSLFAVIKGREVLRDIDTKERIVIAFKPTEERFDIPDAASRRSPEYIQDISALWATDNVNRFTNDFIRQLRTTREVSEKEEDEISNAIGKLHGLLLFQFSALVLSPTMSEEEVAQVFVRINSKGQKLNMTDFVLTLMSVFWDAGRMELEDFSRKARRASHENEASPFNHIFQPTPDEILRVSVGVGFRRARMQYVYSILRGKDLETEQFSEERRDKQFAVLKEAQAKTLNLTNWHEFLKTLKMAGYIRQDFISSRNNIVYAYVMFLLGKYDFGMERDALRNLIARWFFFISLTGRYTGSPETDMEADFGHVKTVQTGEEFTEALNKIITSGLTDDYWGITMPVNDLATSSPRSPALFAYYASLKILNADGLFSRLKVSDLLEAGLKEKRSPLERHHLFPRAYLERIGFSEQTDRNQIANYALVEWGDNMDISDGKPSEYLPPLLARMNDEERKQMYLWHALPEDWEGMEYRDFLTARRKLMAQVVKVAFSRLK